MNNSHPKNESAFEAIKQNYLDEKYPGDLADVLDSGISLSQPPKSSSVTWWVLAALLLIGITIGFMEWASQQSNAPTPVAKQPRTSPRKKVSTPILFSMTPKGSAKKNSAHLPITRTPSLNRSKSKRIMAKTNAKPVYLFPTKSVWTVAKLSVSSEPKSVQTPNAQTQKKQRLKKKPKQETTSKKRPKSKFETLRERRSKSRFRYEPLKSIRL